jgi:hypothetical protein
MQGSLAHGRSINRIRNRRFRYEPYVRLFSDDFAGSRTRVMMRRRIHRARKTAVLMHAYSEIA